MKRSEKTITSTALLASPRALEMAVEFLNNVVRQIPEKPDYWCSCGQCERNIDAADDIIDEANPGVLLPPQSGGKEEPVVLPPDSENQSERK